MPYVRVQAFGEHVDLCTRVLLLSHPWNGHFILPVGQFLPNGIGIRGTRNRTVVLTTLYVLRHQSGQHIVLYDGSLWT